MLPVNYYYYYYYYYVTSSAALCWDFLFLLFFSGWLCSCSAAFLCKLVTSHKELTKLFWLPHYFWSAVPLGSLPVLFWHYLNFQFALLHLQTSTYWLSRTFLAAAYWVAARSRISKIKTLPASGENTKTICSPKQNENEVNSRLVEHYDYIHYSPQIPSTPFVDSWSTMTEIFLEINCFATDTPSLHDNFKVATTAVSWALILHSTIYTTDSSAIYNFIGQRLLCVSTIQIMQQHKQHNIQSDLSTIRKVITAQYNNIMYYYKM